MPRQFLALTFVLMMSAGLFGQPLNDDCEGAIRIDNPSSYCSGSGAFSNVDATSSIFDAPTCFEDVGGDVWFSFVPIATTVTVTIIGSSEPGNTLSRPEAALYQGECEDVIAEWRCAPNTGNGIVEFTRGSLLIGERYFIRVQGRGQSTGSFELCMRNFNPPVQPGQDCPTMSVLCNKEPFVVQSVSGPGQDPTEANDATCFEGALGGGNVESASTWFSWTALHDGALTFDLIPLNPTDDLDFVVYELPNGPGDCTDKVLLRCMASSCFGPTGLKDGEIDLGEAPNCDDPRQNNYLKPLDMKEGVSYALMVNNFSETGNGFDMRFDGEGEFRGPVAEYTTNVPDSTICVGAPMTFTDNSDFPEGSITEWSWEFGSSASIANATGPGPHEVSYSRAGTKSVVLTITTDLGCTVTEVGTILVECCPDHFVVDGEVHDETCANVQDGGIDITVVEGFAPYAFEWSTGATTEDLVGVPPGEYTLFLSDAATCDTTLEYTISLAPPFEVDTLIQAPTCGGGTDGSVELIVSGGAPPYEFNWENGGYTTDNSLSGLTGGDYSVVIRDQNDCVDTLLISVRELNIQLDEELSLIRDPSCDGFADGIIELAIGNGQAPYQYNWNRGRGLEAVKRKEGLPTGTYSIDIVDANRCRGNISLQLEAPPPLSANMQVLDASCFGDNDGMIEAAVSGGVRPYGYTWNTGAADSVITGLAAGNYSLKVVDENGCILDRDAVVNQPDELVAQVLNVVDVNCFGEATGEITLGASGGQAPYLYGVGDNGFQPDPTIGGLFAGSYFMQVQDASGCVDPVPVEIRQSRELQAGAGDDIVITLGKETSLDGSSNDPMAALRWFSSGPLSCSECRNPVVAPVFNTTYTIQATDALGCMALDSMQVLISPDRPVYFPNAFSPDGDGVNDFFSIFGGPGLRQVRALRIFDRWGNLLFEQENVAVNDDSSGWDGKVDGRELDTGVYVYLAEVEFIDDEVLNYSGDVLLMR